MLEPHFSEGFKKQYKKFPLTLQRKFTKQLKLLLQNYKHPSLRAKKMSGCDTYEARLDYHNRFVYMISGQEIWFLAIGPHEIIRSIIAASKRG